MPIHGYLGGVISATAPYVTTAGASGVFTLEEQLQASAQNNWPGYQISRSVRLRSSASAYLNRTLSTPTNNKIWTWSAWLKRGTIGDGGTTYISKTSLFEAPSSGSTFDSIYIKNADAIVWYFATGGATTGYLESTALFRDPSAWYHLVFVYDSTQATDSNRMKVYVNGSQIAVTSAQYVAQNTNSRINSAVVHKIGAFDADSRYADCYLTEINFVDGQALTPASFGVTDSVTGVWNPIRYSGTYGNNGFYLNFKDPTSTTTIGYDYSGNSNNWTANNISVTAGSTYDSMVDVPIGYGSDTGVGGELRGNYCTFNPVYIVSGNSNSGGTWSNGNLQFTNGSTNNNSSMPTMALPTTGKWYWEIVTTAFGGGSNPIVGICDYTGGANGSGGWYYRSNGNKYDQSGNGFSYGATWTTNDVISVAVDMDAATPTFYKNGVSQGVAWTSITSNVSNTLLYPYVRVNVAGDTYVANFGQRAFTYTAPSGYKCLCTTNLPTPTISNGANHMAATIWTGNGASSVTVNNSVNSISFQPDFVWAKNRTTAVGHSLYDSIRGAGANTELNSASTNAEGAGNQDQYGYLSAFNSNGFTGVNGSSSPNYYFNESGSGFVGWQWKGGGTAVTNTAGSITSSVSANTSAGFSVLTYTGTGSNATVGHGLGVAPNMVITKRRDAADGWVTYHTSLTSGAYILSLQSTNAQSSSATVYNSMTTRNSTVYSIGTDTSTNTSSGTYVAYCFAAISGYSAFGSWQNNNSTNGTFIYTGFRPRFILLKNSDNVENWFIWDSARQTYNMPAPSLNWLQPNTANAEGTNSANTAEIDGLSNGFKIYTTNPASGEISFGTRTYIYAAFAENPFNISRAR